MWNSTVGTQFRIRGWHFSDAMSHEFSCDSGYPFYRPGSESSLSWIIYNRLGNECLGHCVCMSPVRTNEDQNSPALRPKDGHGPQVWPIIGPSDLKHKESSSLFWLSTWHYPWSGLGHTDWLVWESEGDMEGNQDTVRRKVQITDSFIPEANSTLSILCFDLWLITSLFQL